MYLMAKVTQMAADFLENEGNYRIGYIEAEQSNPKTRNLDSTIEQTMIASTP